ncbi:hypothetical protein ABZP36_023470 [Zizania latifolia]
MSLTDATCTLVEASISFLMKVRFRFLSRPAVYEELSAVLRENGKDPTPIVAPVVDRAVALLHGHPDLLRGFAEFLPTPSHEEPEADHRPSPKRKRAATYEVKADAVRPSRAKKPRTADLESSLHANDDDDAVRPSRAKSGDRLDGASA